MKKNTSPAMTMIRGAILLIAGIVMIIISAKDVFNSFTEPQYLYDMSTEEIKDGEYVQEYIYAALDYFMYEETTRSKYGIELSSNVSAYYYIVPVLTADAEELYMAVEVGASAESAMNSICDDTYMYLMGEMSDSEFGYNSYHVKGNIRDMKNDELSYMVDWFQDTEYFGTTNRDEIKQYIYPVVLEKYNGTSSRVMMIIGAIFTLIGALIVIFVSAATRRLKKTEMSTQEITYENGNAQPNVYTTNDGYVQNQEQYLYNSTYDEK